MKINVSLKNEDNNEFSSKTIKNKNKNVTFR